MRVPAFELGDELRECTQTVPEIGVPDSKGLCDSEQPTRTSEQMKASIAYLMVVQ